MTTSYYIRKHSNSNSASIYIRINEGRYKQFRFGTGYGLTKDTSWNKNTQSVRTNSIEPYDLINLQLKINKRIIHQLSLSLRNKHQENVFQYNYTSLSSEYQQVLFA